MSIVQIDYLGKNVNKLICGNIVRIGGSVNQLLNYRGKSVQDINILDGGFGSIKSVFQSSRKELKKIFIRKLKQEIKYLVMGSKIPLDRKTVELDMHYGAQKKELKNRFDSVISSNVLEHSPNIIFLLLNLHFIVKKNGFMFHALPNFNYTFDRYRKPTDLDHFIYDFENKTGFDDSTHTADYIQSAIVKDGYQKDFHKKYPVKYPYMHFHVFDIDNTNQLFSYIFEGVECSLIRTDQFSDNLVLCSNELNKNFKNKYISLINQIENGTYY